MKNWLKICKFTLKQAIRGSKFIASTAIVGIVILVIAIASNILLSEESDSDSPISEVTNVYIVNETDLNIDTGSFTSKRRSKYPNLEMTVITDKNAVEAAADPNASVVFDISEDEEGCGITVYIPEGSPVSGSAARDLAWEFKRSISDARISSIGISEDEFKMAVSDINSTEQKAGDSEDEQSLTFVGYMAPLAVMMILYFFVIFYGQSIGQVVSIEKTSKLMEYILTLTGPSGIIFGKVTAVFIEALIQICIWIACGACGLIISDRIVNVMFEGNGQNIISSFMEMLPEGGVSGNFVVLLILAVIALLSAFLFYCFVSALFASFAATAEELTQTNSMSVMTMLAGFLGAMYIPLITDNSAISMTIIRIIPFTAAFCLPGDVVSARIGILQYLLYLALLLFFTVMLAVLIGRVYKNRLFKKGTKGIFSEMVSAITGKVKSSPDEADITGTEGANAKALSIKDFENYDKAKKTYTIIGFALLVLILSANALGGSIGNVIAKFMAKGGNRELLDIYKDKTFLAITNSVGTYLIAFPLFMLVAGLTNDSVILKKGKMTTGQLLRALFMLFPVDIGIAYISQRLAAAITGGEAENSFVAGLTTGENIPVIIMVAFLAPIFEELIFRKLIIDRTRKYGETMAIVYSALAFGIFHCNIYQIFYAFALGLILGYVYVRTGNVIYTILMHMSINASASIMYPLSPDAYKYFCYIMIALGVLSILFTFIKKDVVIETTENQVASKELSKVALFNSGSVLFVLVCALISIYVLVVSTMS